MEADNTAPIATVSKSCFANIITSTLTRLVLMTTGGDCKASASTL